MKILKENLFIPVVFKRDHYLNSPRDETEEVLTSVDERGVHLGIGRKAACFLGAVFPSLPQSHSELLCEVILSPLSLYPAVKWPRVLEKHLASAETAWSSRPELSASDPWPCLKPGLLLLCVSSISARSLKNPCQRSRAIRRCRFLAGFSIQIVPRSQLIGAEKVLTVPMLLSVRDCSARS